MMDDASWHAFGLLYALADAKRQMTAEWWRVPPDPNFPNVQAAV